MLVFASEFPASAAKTLSDLFRVCHTWLTGSPHYGLQGMPEFTPPPDDIVESSSGQHRVWIGMIEEKQRTLGGVRHLWIEEDTREWITEVVGVESSDGLWISVNIFCHLLVAGSRRPNANKPYVIKQLFNSLGGGTDGE